MYNVKESEHQELFHRGVNLTTPLTIHIPSPLFHLGYYFFVRVKTADIGRLNAVSARFDLVGLHESHVDMALGAGSTEPREFACSDAGFSWYCLGKADLARGEGPMVLTGWPADMQKVDLLICTWPRFVSSGEADQWLAAQADPVWAPSGVPLGGIGSGRVDICRDGRFRNFSMNNNQDAPVESPDGLPGAFLAVSEGDKTVELASRPVVAGHSVCKTLIYTPRFPQAVLNAPQVIKGLDAAVTFTGTLCPHDLRRSSIPGFLLRWELKNLTSEPRTVKCTMGWPNLVGIGGGVGMVESSTGQGDGCYRHWEDPTGRKETRDETEVYTGIRFTGEPGADFKASAGAHLLAVLRHSVKSTGVVIDSGRGEVFVEIEVPANGHATAMMALVVEMPHWMDSLGVDRGCYWQNEFASAGELMAALFKEHQDVLDEAGSLARLLDDSSLPDWLKRRLSNCCYPLVTNSVLYKDGRFSINEGPTEMSGCYGTIDQRLGAHPATQFFFPDLNAKELSEFASIQGPEGGIQHDLGGGNLERKSGEHTWPDLTLSFILQAARHAWSTGDRDFGRTMWPVVKGALLRHAKWAEEGNGVAHVGKGLGTSYDSYHYIGTTGYMGTLWLAALAVVGKWAENEADKELGARICVWREAAVKRLEKDLWNGTYFDAYGDSEGQRRHTCHAGQLAGQGYARLLAGCDVLPEEKVRSCVAAMIRLNGGRNFALPPDEVSADGKDPSEFGWLPYVEAFMLAACAREDSAWVWPVWKRMCRAMGPDARPCDTRLMYRPKSGEPSWGAYYMTAPASWLVYEAIVDFAYYPEDCVLRLGSAVPGRYPVVHPLFWGVAQVSADGTAHLTVKRVFRKGLMSVTALELPKEVKLVEIEGKPVQGIDTAGRYRRYPLPLPWRLRIGAILAWRARRTIRVEE